MYISIISFPSHTRDLPTSTINTTTSSPQLYVTVSTGVRGQCTDRLLTIFKCHFTIRTTAISSIEYFTIIRRGKDNTTI